MATETKYYFERPTEWNNTVGYYMVKDGYCRGFMLMGDRILIMKPHWVKGMGGFKQITQQQYQTEYQKMLDYLKEMETI